MLPTWTFERGAERLIVQRDEADEQLILTNGATSRTLPFSDQAALVTFQHDMEAFLLRTGWLLASFAPDRRRRDRRTFPRETPDRRRWWTDGLRLFSRRHR